MAGALIFHISLETDQTVTIMPPVTVHSASVRPSEFIHWILYVKSTWL